MKDNKLNNIDIGQLIYSKALVDSIINRYVKDENMEKETKRLKTISDKLSQLISKD